MKKTKKLMLIIGFSALITSFISCTKKSLEEQGILLNMTNVSGGVFTIGDGLQEASDGPSHTVILSGFEMSADEISQDVYNKVLNIKSAEAAKDSVVNISWNEAVEFCNRLSKKAGLKPCYKIQGETVTCNFLANGYRLPTEAEWEYAVKKGFPVQNSDEEDENPSANQQNLLGIENLNNGIGEWCYDFYAPYTQEEQINPSNSEKGTDRVIRGTDSNFAARAHSVPSKKDANTGFRIVRSGNEYGKDVESIREAYYQEIYSANRKKFQPLTKMISVAGGSFQMGSADGSDLEKPVHQVTITNFELGATEVTNKLFKEVMGRKTGEFVDGEDSPVQDASWYDAILFCNKLSLLEGRTPCYKINNEADPAKWGDVPYAKIEQSSYGDEQAASYMNVIGNTTLWDSVTCDFKADGYRLPTEAEWEFAAKGGVNNSNTKYSGSNKLDEVAMHDGIWKHRFVPTAAQKKPNALGLYDMSGSAWEWCWDWSASYTQEAQNDPTGPSTGKARIRRGGSVMDTVDTADYSVTSRSSYEPCYSSNCNYPFEKAGLFGFRIARTAN